MNVKTILSQAGIRPGKGLGQNFLVDQQVVFDIIDGARLKPGEPVLEIGPGLGALTLPLLTRGHPVIAVERDPRLAALLSAQQRANLTVLQADAIHLDYRQLSPQPLPVVANLPYSVAAPILFALMASVAHFSALTLMFQKEVADRIQSAPGHKSYGILSVFCQRLFLVERVLTVPPESFHPPPKILSAVIHMEKRQDVEDVGDEKRFHFLVKTAFAQRRKTLGNALKGLEGSQETLERAGISPRQRAEEISVAGFSRLSRLWSHPLPGQDPEKNPS